MKKVKLKLVNLLMIVFFLGIFNIKAAEQKTASESLTSESYPIPQEIIEKGNIIAAQNALNNRANINAKYRTGFYQQMTPLTVAINRQNIEMVSFLLKNGANVNQRIYNDITPLILAVRRFCEPEIVNLLLENGANIDDQDDEGDTALISLVQLNVDKLVKILLCANANINIANKKGETFLSILNTPVTYSLNAPTRQLRRKEILREYNEFISKVYPIPLEIIKTGDVEAVKKALNDGANINAKYENGPFKGLTALMVAIFKSTEEIVRLLIEKGADINAQTEHGNTALYIAVFDKSVSLVKLLLDNNANVNSALSTGTTPLIHIATGGSLEILRMLLDHGAKIDLKDKWGDTALMHAAKSIHPDEVKILLNAGADIYVRDNNKNDFPSLIESNESYKEIREVYEEFLRSCPIPLEIIEKGDIKAAQEALNKGADVNAKYKSPFYFMGFSALNVAIYLNKVAMFEFLLKNNADLNSKTLYGYTSLKFASFNNNPDIVKTLIDNGVDINVQGYFDGRIALIDALTSRNGTIQNKISIVKLLLNAGADVYIADGEGKTFLDYINEPINDLFREEQRKQILKTYEEFLDEKALKNIQLKIAENNCKKVIEFIAEFPQLIDYKNEIGETILSETILFGRIDIIKELFENPNIKIKPNLLVGRKSKYLFDQTNPVEYAHQLGRPGSDPAKKVYRDIAAYLKEQRDLQEALQTKTNEKIVQHIIWV